MMMMIGHTRRFGSGSLHLPSFRIWILRHTPRCSVGSWTSRSMTTPLNLCMSSSVSSECRNAKSTSLSHRSALWVALIMDMDHHAKCDTALMIWIFTGLVLSILYSYLPLFFCCHSLEFKSNPIFKQQLDMDRAGNAGMVGGGEDVSPHGMSQVPKWQGGGAEANVMTF